MSNDTTLIDLTEDLKKKNAKLQEEVMNMKKYYKDVCV